MSNDKFRPKNNGSAIDPSLHNMIVLTLFSKRNEIIDASLLILTGHRIVTCCTYSFDIIFCSLVLMSNTHTNEYQSPNSHFQALACITKMFFSLAVYTDAKVFGSETV